jgi:hypothetical protein
MKKSSYIIILFLLSFGYFDYILITENSKDILLFATWLWGGFGFFMFFKSKKNAINIYSNKKYTYWFLAIMCISVLYPYGVYEQPIISTLLAQRENYSIFFLLIFLYIHPFEHDFFIALRFCSYLTIGIMFLSAIFPEFFISTQSIENLSYRQSNGDTEIITANPGAGILMFYFLFQISKTLKTPRTKQMIEVFCLFLIIVLMQNRSRLVFALPIFLYMFFSIKSKGKFFYWIFGLAIISIFSVYIYEIFENLWNESSDQLVSQDYNRWQAISFFLIESKSNFFTVLFGHGISASGSDYFKIIEKAQQERFAYVSDIGLLGSYFLYGLSFIVLLFSFIFKALKKYQPFYIKSFAWFIILVPTIQGFGVLSSQSAILYSMFFYLVIYNLKYYKIAQGI